MIVLSSNCVIQSVIMFVWSRPARALNLSAQFLDLALWILRMLILCLRLDNTRFHQIGAWSLGPDWKWRRRAKARAMLARGLVRAQGKGLVIAQQLITVTQGLDHDRETVDNDVKLVDRGGNHDGSHRRLVQLWGPGQCRGFARRSRTRGSHQL